MRSSLLFIPSERTLIDRIREGDEEALVHLYHANRRPVTAYVLRNSGTVDDAEDLLQEALVILWERIRGNAFEQRAGVGTFLYATARNLWLRRLTKLRFQSPLPEEMSVEEENPLELLIDRERFSAVHQALDRLGNPCKQLLLLFYWDGLRMDAIAKEMGFANAETVKSKKYQCKKALADLVRRELAQGKEQKR